MCLYHPTFLFDHGTSLRPLSRAKPGVRGLSPGPSQGLHIEESKQQPGFVMLCPSLQNPAKSPSTWKFPKMGVPPNHPIIVTGSSTINHPLWCILWKPPKTLLEMVGFSPGEVPYISPGTHQGRPQPCSTKPPSFSMTVPGRYLPCVDHFGKPWLIMAVFHLPSGYD